MKIYVLSSYHKVLGEYFVKDHMPWGIESIWTDRTDAEKEFNFNIEKVSWCHFKLEEIEANDNSPLIRLLFKSLD